MYPFGVLKVEITEWGEGLDRMIANTDGGAIRRSSGSSLSYGIGEGVSELALQGALGRTRQWFLDHQDKQGYWLGELEGDTILESEFVLLMTYLGRERETLCLKLCRSLREQQLPTGGWSIYLGGPAEISASVKGYFALKLVGVSPDEPDMIQARRTVLELGGAQACNSFTRFYLALLGQVGYDEVPSVPAEVTLFPHRMILGRMSVWTQTIIVPLMIMSGLKPCRPLPIERGIAELFRDDLPRGMKRSPHRFSWRNFFLGVDKTLKWCDTWVPQSWRKPGLRAAHRWMLEHFENSDGLGAIFPPMIYTIIALRALGYDASDPTVQWAFQRLDELIIDLGETAHIQPCLSPVWDTALSVVALADGDLPINDPAILKATRWLLDREVRTKADSSLGRRSQLEPTGWHFQFNNVFYPDFDDTVMVLLALRRTSLAQTPEVKAATTRGVEWLLEMQNRDGGWAAFDKDITLELLQHVPFADHNAILDPSCPDITARVIEFLGLHGTRANHPQVAKALEYLWKTQEPEGCWYGRWGVNYVYGTWQSLQGLAALDIKDDHPDVARACEWLESVQQADGSWGESCESYADRDKMGQGEPTASQTAWAVLGLISAGRVETEAVRRGVEYLIDTQKPDGDWDEEPFTGTGFPLVFYLRYHMYRTYFPLMALGRYSAALSARETQPADLIRVPVTPLPLDI